MKLLYLNLGASDQIMDEYAGLSIDREWIENCCWEFYSNLEDCIFVLTDHDGIILKCNTAFSNLLNQSEKELTDKCFYEFIVNPQVIKFCDFFQDKEQPLDNIKKTLILAGPETMPQPFIIDFYTENGTVAIFGKTDSNFSKNMCEQFIKMNNELVSLSRKYIKEQIKTKKAFAESERLKEELQFIAIHDPLTRLYNRREFERYLEVEWQKIIRYQHPLSVLMLDIDHFKEINDQYGHQVGDDVLRGLASILLNEVRKADFLARYGGEEFIIILPETAVNHAIETAERFRGKIEKANFVLGIKVTVSIGVSSFPEHRKSKNALINEADTALYTAKKQGRNRVVYAHL